MTKEVYDNAVNVLLDAYNNGTLFHGKCNACAVGNLMCGLGRWEAVIGTTANGIHNVPELWEGLRSLEDSKKARKRIAEINISVTELQKIEIAFENSIWDTEEGYAYYLTEGNEKQGQFMGLCAVLGVMKDMVTEEVPHTENVERLETIYAGFEN